MEEVLASMAGEATTEPKKDAVPLGPVDAVPLEVKIEV